MIAFGKYASGEVFGEGRFVEEVVRWVLECDALEIAEVFWHGRGGWAGVRGLVSVEVCTFQEVDLPARLSDLLFARVDFPTGRLFQDG